MDRLPSFAPLPFTIFLNLYASALRLELVTTTLSNTWMVILSAIGIYAALILFTRLAGLRSFSKMSNFDFATTVAFGSILGSAVLTENAPLLRAITALATLYAL